jgi:hypothetical protein
LFVNAQEALFDTAVTANKRMSFFGAQIQQREQIKEDLRKAKLKFTTAKFYFNFKRKETAPGK